MNKDEALDLALEALERMKGYGNVFLHRRDERNPHEQVCEAITAIKQARSAPVQEPAIKQGWDVDTLLDKPAAPVRDKCFLCGERVESCTSTVCPKATPFAAQPAPVREPVAWLYKDDWGRTKIAFSKETANDWGAEVQPLYTTPPAAQRQHVTDGSLCWCDPETSYTDPETGASVIVHKGPQ
jgi:hypothetical protein